MRRLDPRNTFSDGWYWYSWTILERI